MEKAYDGDNSVDDSVVELYTAATEEKTKTLILKDFKDKEGKNENISSDNSFWDGH